MYSNCVHIDRSFGYSHRQRWNDVDIWYDESKYVFVSRGVGGTRFSERGQIPETNAITCQPR